MRMRKPESRGTPRPPGLTGFTLVELLVVISIILLLAMLLMPTIQMIIRQFYAGRSAMMVRSLHDGALLYEQETKFLPGEKKDTKVPGGTGDPRQAMNNGSITGSQVLAACLFNIEYDELLHRDFSDRNVAEGRIEASKTYATFKPEYLINGAGKLNSISDGFPKGKAKPVCYFLASNKTEYVDKVSQFRIADNAAYMEDLQGSDDEKQELFEDWVTRRAKTSNVVFNNGRFILLAPGLNRKYIVDDVEDPDAPGQIIQDDITNDYGKRRSGS